ncbi:MAG: PIG-L deacetylase family protein [Actinomycetota bacterium]|nr:PIG-L deacetylase family protein [Actinomycetota bacterium]
MSGWLAAMPDDWQRLLAVVAHPDDLEYGAASAIARWTAAGKWVGYVIVTDGEAGIDGMHPSVAGPVREHEQRTSAAIVGVDEVVFLHRADGTLEHGLELRRLLAREIRRHRPDVLLVANYDLTYSMAPGEHVVNQADHRAVGLAALDGARDAGNRWIFPELVDEGLQPWSGVSDVYVMGSNDPLHAVDVTDTLPIGVKSLQAHATYLDGLGREFDPDAFLRRMTAAPGAAIGTDHAVALGRVRVHGV